MDELGVALARLRTAREGGTLLTRGQAEALLTDAGCHGVRSLPHELLPTVWMTAASAMDKAQPGSRAR